MDHKIEFFKLVEENRFEEARCQLDKLKYEANEDSFYYGNQGWILNHMERYQEAEILLRMGINVFPQDGWLHSQLGYCLDRQGHLTDGLQNLLKALELGFDEPWVHGEIGWCYKEESQFKKAIEYFENGLLDDPSNAFILSQAAFVYIELEDLKTAERYLKKSYQYQSDNDGLYDLASFYHHQKQYEVEIEYLNQISDRADSEEIQYELGVAYYRCDQYEHASSHLLCALTLGKDDTEIRTYLGDVLRMLHHEEESDMHYNIALEYYEKALLNEQDSYWIYQEMIWIAHKQKDQHKKLAYLDRSFKSHGESVWLMYHFARCYSDLQIHDKAIEACAYCMQFGEKSKEMYDLYAWNLGRCDQEDKAIELLLECMKHFPADDWNYGELGWNYAQLNQFDQAKDYFDIAVEMNPKSPLHKSMLGWCYLRLKKYTKAYTCVKQAMKLGRSDGWIHAVFAEIAQAKQLDDEAIEHYQYAIDLGYKEAWIHQNMKKLKAKSKG